MNNTSYPWYLTWPAIVVAFLLFWPVAIFLIYLRTKNSKGDIFAATSNKIENASMEFDSTTLKPKYKLNIGIPGSSNAIEISETLGLDSKVIDKAKSYLDGKQVSFEHVLKQAEEAVMTF